MLPRTMVQTWCMKPMHEASYMTFILQDLYLPVAQINCKVNGLLLSPLNTYNDIKHWMLEGGEISLKHVT